MIRAKLFVDGVPTQLTADESIVLRLEDGISLRLDNEHGKDNFELLYFFDNGDSAFIAQGDSYNELAPAIKLYNENWEA